MSAPVIVGVDGGEASEDALRLGQWTAQTLDAPLIVAVVHPAPSALGSGRVDAEWVADRHRAATAVLDGARTVLAGATGDIAYRVVASTSAAHGLHDLAEELSAEVIVVGSGRAGSRHRLFAGSTAERLLAQQRLPRRGRAGRDGDAAGRAGPRRRRLRGHPPTAGRRSRRRPGLRRAPAARCGCTRWSRMPTPQCRSWSGRTPSTRSWRPPGETYELALSRAAESAAGVETDWEIRVGDVVESLADLDDVDVLFCGSRGYGPARRVLLGGVSARLVRRARRPVVIVPRSAAGQT
nr:hypothetical protein GCM10020092_047080 [Actinoplanes digitatis]